MTLLHIPRFPSFFFFDSDMTCISPLLFLSLRSLTLAVSCWFTMQRCAILAFPPRSFFFFLLLYCGGVVGLPFSGYLGFLHTQKENEKQQFSFFFFFWFFLLFLLFCHLSFFCPSLVFFFFSSLLLLSSQWLFRFPESCHFFFLTCYPGMTEMGEEKKKKVSTKTNKQSRALVHKRKLTNLMNE